MTIEQVLRAYGEDFIRELRRNIVAKDGVASGAMLNDSYTEVETNPDGYTLALYAPDYLKWWDQGTYPHWAPIEPLKKWVEVKGLQPTERNGKMPTVEQLPYLIQHGIAENGTEGRKVVNAVAELCYTKWEDALVSAMEDEIGDLLKGLTK